MKDRDPDPTVVSGKGFPLSRFAPTVTEIELTVVRHANVPLCVHVSIHTCVSRMAVEEECMADSMHT